MPKSKRSAEPIKSVGRKKCFSSVEQHFHGDFLPSGRKSSVDNPMSPMKSPYDETGRTHNQASATFTKTEDSQDQQARVTSPSRKKIVIGNEPCAVVFTSANPLPEAFGDVESGCHRDEAPNKTTDYGVNGRRRSSEPNVLTASRTRRRRSSSGLALVLLVLLFISGVLAAMHFSGLLKKQ
ncbi:hypothetical protein M514_02695 [Trichuris suis]|uniref:Uncharacterized protein n=1 Tax=Trichuris suis TaxID=68888 RepID=A0A085MH95_9BILA|nr:hypothetical protein M513_02695 [Trichuris suis]KFD71117.1 hypothetical protein M514_02695 [Trichuris suis]